MYLIIFDLVSLPLCFKFCTPSYIFPKDKLLGKSNSISNGSSTFSSGSIFCSVSALLLFIIDSTLDFVGLSPVASVNSDSNSFALSDFTGSLLLGYSNIISAKYSGSI